MPDTRELTYDPADLWELTLDDLEALEVGAGILGTGGGGNPYQGKLLTREAMKAGHKMTILSTDKIADDALCMSIGGIGAPVVGTERIREGREGLRCLQGMEELTGRKMDAIVCEEIGGANSMNPLVTAALGGLPVLDCDGMGRAFPEMQMTTFSIYGHSSTPSVMCDLHGNRVVFQHAVTEVFHERMARACVVAQGGAAMLATAPMPASFVRQNAIPQSYTKAIRLGRAVLDARRNGDDPVATVCALEGGRHVFTGKITDLKRHLRGGFAVGDLELGGFDGFQGQTASIAIQNEFLIFRREGEVEVTVPDLIIVLDVDTGYPITTEMLRYGQRIAVLAVPCHDLLRSARALDVVGPAAFGYPEIPFAPLAPLGQAA
ncbi:DUF917 domain-containing protein [Yangia mangrovi]|uniref:DUF917 domain-containing protein n=1 Tax=Alloyangia mangrovi TaxID=1779329 RepID=A0A2A3JUM7_9RHOB|nr:DUF917 domain-containing protein [Alloyangia mangrovi]MCA0939920.1 DUF917 domain-containing protein [Alloyangia pacifica]MCA0945058.1 DUF917 domain-containing protein [Alloyangia pacifica]MCT4370113.1 DUF917 domain-containing protein [Alloyangia mangrovi]